MTTEPRAFLTIDAGAATIAAALIGRVGGRWRLVGSLSMPAGSDVEAVVSALGDRAVAADPNLAAALDLGRGGVSPTQLPRLEVSSHAPRRLAVVAASDRALAPLVATASRSGWRTVSGSAEAIDPLAMTTLLLDRTVSGVLLGAGDPPGADERRALGELAALVAAAAGRRPELVVVLAGGMAEHLAAFGDPGSRPGEVLLGPAAERGSPGGPLADLLIELAFPPDDARRSLGAGAMALAEILDRRVDVVEIGYDAGTRAAGSPSVSGIAPALDLAVVPTAALAPADPDDSAVDRVGRWSTWGADRHRLRDRLRELRIAPWADATGEGVTLRMAAARAALGRLAEWTPEWAERPPADLVVVTGGAWAVAPAPAVALAVMDVLRRPGAGQFALDHARILAPLGSIPEPDERRAMIADLIDDLLAPLGTVITPAGMHTGRSAGSVVVHATDGSTRLDLMPGGLALIDLPPGVSAVAEFKFRDAVRLGTRGRHFAIDVTGGLGGLVIDLRDIPLRLPDRADLRAELLESWHTAIVTGRNV
ncbi:MAG TPA: hypothetical protein VGO15_01355 [Candidatus Limnocylindrales bacterium]|nr:hypothetical protein [Candidatus Limnocylindrales bacterium]